MFGQVKRDADGLAVLQSHRNFDIDIAPFYIFAKNPHFPSLV